MVFANSNFAELRTRLLTRHYKWVSSHHHPELAVVDLPVPVLVHRPDHLVDLLVRHLARQVGQDKLELLCSDATLVVLAEHSKRLLQLVLCVGVAQFLVHHQTELRKLEKSGSVNIDLSEADSKVLHGLCATQPVFLILSQNILETCLHIISPEVFTILNSSPC